MKCFSPALLLMLLPAVMMSQSSSSSPAPRQAPAITGTQPATQASPNQISDNDPLLDVAPLPKSKVTLVGGKVRSIDQIRNRMTVDTFGGGKMKFVFDERSHIYRDGVETTQLAIKKGDRVYVDSQLDGPKVFARSVRVVTQLTPADADGQLLSLDRRNNILSMRDRLSSQPLRFQLTADTKIFKDNEQPGSQADLQPGALVGVEFAPDRANRGIAQKIKVLAVPGASFRFAGRITHLDVKSSTMAIENSSDGKNYEVAFNRDDVNGRDDLAVGAEVNVIAIFQGDKYLAREMTVTQAASQEDKDKEKKKDDKDKDKTSENDRD
ncbi:MAG: hypothetical protein HYX28_00910 [Candidatus Koribacter versatilis]|uniref:DUF5666 domain-containing protein n=1 Tax=Candidatus Korobacter versatilis TaxID=658062 RepID=A0A932EPS8_9BACT|nr:hypothetical protein [Candidatus Koribacter versatilis]